MMCQSDLRPVYVYEPEADARSGLKLICVVCARSSLCCDAKQQRSHKLEKVQEEYFRPVFLINIYMRVRNIHLFIINECTKYTRVDNRLWVRP